MGLETISREVRPDEAAWLAGIIDGEGWITLCQVRNDKITAGKQLYMEIGVRNTDPYIIKKISEIYKVIGNKFCYSLTEKDNHHKNILAIKVHGSRNCRKIILEILPYLSGKKKQAEVLLEYIEWRLDKRNFEWRKNPISDRPEVKAFIEKLQQAKQVIDPSTTRRKAGEILKI